MSNFCEEEVIGHYLERAKAELDLIGKRGKAFANNPELMPATGNMLQKFAGNFACRIYLDSRGPSPLLLLSRLLQFDINDKPADSRRSSQLLGNFVLPGLRTTASERLIVASQSTNDNTNIACVQTEARFVGALKQIKTRSYRLQSRVSVTVDETGTPVLFRKGNAESTALTLCNLEVGGCIFPPGTIVDVRDNNENNPTHTKRNKLNGHREQLDVHAIPEDLTAAPVRLSPWAFDDPLDRAIFGMSGGIIRGASDLQMSKDSSFEASRAEIAQTYNISDFRDAANQVLLLCGANVPAAA